MNFLSQKLKATLYAVATGASKSIRAICAVSRLPYESIRRQLSRLYKVKELYTRFVLEKYCPGDTALVVIDPTYLRELTDGLIVAGLLVPGMGRCIPLYWEHFNWKETEREQEGLYSRNLFQGSFLRKLKKLVYPRTLIIIADREFGRTGFFEVLKKAGIYWVIRLPKNNYPPKLGDHLEFSDEAHDEPWLLCFRLPPGYNPSELYFLRMRIEETFRDAKSLLAMKVILNRLTNPLVKEGLVLLLFASWLLLADLGSQATKNQFLRQSVLNMAERGYYSTITLGRLWLCACAIRALAEVIAWQELTGG